MKKVIFNPENPNGLELELTADEIAQVEADNVLIAEKDATELAEKNQKETDQANGNKKLLDLGLTQAEATALTGYTPPIEE
jgi:hypothetical protein|tara:strand:+ start:579 stop:821 length:243 start_codon:yes stop_codon:yes gene_type:complete